MTGNAAGGSPTGSVSFYECGPTATAQSCTSEANPIGSPVNVSPGHGDTATATSAFFTPNAEGYWCMAAVYSGDGNYLGSSDTTTGECFYVNGPVTIVTTSPLPGGTVGHAYSTTLTARGGKAPYSWHHKSSPLPRSLTLNAATGVISGTPKAAGTYSFTVTVKDSSHPKESAMKTFSITISS